MNQEVQKVTLELTVQQVNVILAGIAKLPLEASLDTFNAIQQQANAQLTQLPRAEEPPVGEMVN